MKTKFSPRVLAPVALSFLAASCVQTPPVGAQTKPAQQFVPSLPVNTTSVMGSGNFDMDKAQYFDAQFAVLKANGMKSARFNVYPAEYWDGNQARVRPDYDKLILQAHKNKITPMLLFNFYGMWLGPGSTLGPKEKWVDIGRVFAQRYRPNSPWLLEQGIKDWGVTVWSAFNEPDHHGFGKLPKTASDEGVEKAGGNYRDALEGFSDGVKGVDRSLQVIPGGYMAQCAFMDFTCGGYALAVADLFNNGKLDGLHLHTYNDSQYAPLFGHDTSTWSAFSNFKAVKEKCGITADVDFYSDEYNYKNPDHSETKERNDDLTAKNLLTATWANLSAAKNDGRTPASKMLLLWSLFPVESTYTTSKSFEPYEPLAPAKTYALVNELTENMRLVSVDPFGSGVTVLEGNKGAQNRKMWAWINAKGYTNRLGDSLTVSEIPQGTKTLSLYRYNSFDGPAKTVQYNGEESVKFDGLGQKETFMVVAR